jgi:hypothetical protein
MYKGLSMKENSASKAFLQIREAASVALPPLRASQASEKRPL